MSSSLRINTSVDLGQQRLEQLLAQQAEVRARDEEIAAEIASLLPTSASSTSYPHHRSPIHKHQRRSNVPRSMSSNGVPTMSRHLSSDRIEATAISRSLSQRSAPMARTNSRGSSSQRSGQVPFTSNGPMRPMPPPLESRRDSPALISWDTNEQPLSSYTFSHQPQPLQRSMSQHRSELERVPENSHVLEDPSEFLSRTFGKPITPVLSISPPMSLPPTTPSNHRLSTGSYNIPTPSTPSTDTLTNATTLTNNTMSRTNSLFNEPLPESMQMLRFSSNTSYSDISHVDHMYDQVTPTFTSSRHNRRSSNEEQDQLLVGAGGASHDSQFSHSLPTHFTSSGSFGEKMEKSQSNESASSSSSRNKLRLQAQNQQAAARPLMPKGGSDDNAMSRNNSSHSMCRLDSKDGSQDKVAISKPTYQRPKHDRVYCKQCESHPEGFRGEHELRRHQDREHKQLVKKWVCIEPTGDGLSHPKPILPLSRCKACGQQKKKYGAYYNAAAHLRRTHFKPKTSKGRSKGSSKDLDEKRGGKGGGDWPPMSELKYWMKEVEEAAPEYALTESQQDEADASDDEVDTPLDDQVFSQPNLSSIGSNFDNSIYADASPLFNAYQPIANDMYNMQMPLESQGQCMDQSMYNSSSQGSFPNFSPNVFQNDPYTVFEPSLQNFEDQVALAGPDFVAFSYQ